MEMYFYRQSTAILYYKVEGLRLTLEERIPYIESKMRTRESQMNALKLHCPHCNVIMFVHLLPRSDSWLQSVGKWEKSRKSFLPLFHTAVDSDRSTLLLKHFLLNSAQTGLQCAVRYVAQKMTYLAS